MPASWLIVYEKGADMGILYKLFGSKKQEQEGKETLGNTEPTCPYCSQSLVKMPGKKTKCPSCGKFMYVRTRPSDRKRVIVTEQDAAKIEEQWAIKNGMPVSKQSQSFEGPAMPEAIKHSQTKGAQIAAKYELMPSTGEKIAQIVSDGIKNKTGILGISRDIRKQFPDINKAKADNIAQTESADSLESAFMDRSKAMGVTGKEIVVTDPCDICRAFADEGIVPIDHEYVYEGKSYGQKPPFHSGCRCALAPVMLDDK
ncbi:MAG: hypothetical protein A2158_03860 [Chloroflexi bacterium RBG_13_46_14]|nr:MAG: hypothetical protein A2158_03860 [Chloroflexi bacterium RBG_13_46_14]